MSKNNGLDQETLVQFFQLSQTGIALLDITTLVPTYKNEFFAQWFPETASIDKLIPSFSVDKLKKKLGRGKDYSCEHEIKRNNRSKIIKLQFSQPNDTNIYVIATDYTKEKEQEFLLDSYVKMAESNRIKLEKSLATIRSQKEELLVINAALERERNSVELRALQAVINPHFVSNSLASIQGFILEKEVKTAVNYIAYFGKLMRLSFEQAYYDYVSIREILVLLETYVSIEKMRVDKYWELVLKIDEQVSVDNLKIPPLLIQPFLENAIWHGINKKEGDGRVIVQFDLIDEITLKCTIEDNGVGRKFNEQFQEKNKNSLHSLNVTSKRLNILWEEHERKHDIVYTDLFEGDKPAGTRVELFIPINF